MKLCLILLVLLWKNVGFSLTQTAIFCEKPLIDNGVVLGDKQQFRENEFLRYSCNLGYKKVDGRPSVCQLGLTAQWIPRPECEPIKCAPISVQDNVQVNGDTYEPTFGNVLQFSCKDRSQVLLGEMELFCDENGKWNNDPPTCEEISCEKPLIDNGNAQGDKQHFRENEFLRYSCNLGYKKVDGRLAMCHKLGLTVQWIPRPECESLTCKLSYNPPGTTTYDPQDQLVFRPGQTVRVSCGEKEWVKSSELRSAQIECQETGLWDFPPECQLVTCIKRAEHVVQWERSWNAIEMGDTLGYWCENGYDKTTDSRAVCTRQGWRPDPLCKAITDCGPIPAIPHMTETSENSRFSEGHTIPIRCESGYRNLHVGLQSITCKKGKWDSNRVDFKTICTPIENKCNPPVTVENAVILAPFQKEYLSNTSLTYKCRDNFKIEGEDTVRCINGTWEKTISCKGM